MRRTVPGGPREARCQRFGRNSWIHTFLGHPTSRSVSSRPVREAVGDLGRGRRARTGRTCQPAEDGRGCRHRQTAWFTPSALDLEPKASSSSVRAWRHRSRTFAPSLVSRTDGSYAGLAAARFALGAMMPREAGRRRNAGLASRRHGAAVVGDCDEQSEAVLAVHSLLH